MKALLALWSAPRLREMDNRGPARRLPRLDSHRGESPFSDQLVHRSGAAFDPDTGTLSIEVSRIVVDGRVIESDGKTGNAA
ncbi:MAG TPA: hypothetical protein VHS30_35630 [Streptosporangiaceae bacterium]|jgi:hypothetical protein|nr:hypothetical protein [Streptosporangiaceae bacterium]